MPTLPGICGPANRPCKISHSSSYPNQVGVYPSQFLPSTFTIWHAVFASNFPPALPSDTGIPPFGLPIAGLVGVDSFIPNLGQTHTFQSHHYIIFAKTANRINVPHILTQQEIDSIGQDGRPFNIGVINVGEYVFECVYVCDQQQTIDLSLSQSELDEILNSGESDSDRAFRKLFEQPIPDEINRLSGIQVNNIGIEYRLDNGTEKSRLGLDQSGIGDLNSASYRDGTSKFIEVDLLKVTPRLPNDPNLPPPETGSLQQESRTPRAGDTIYITYVAITEHYIRQRINISWQVFDGGSSLDCISLPLNYSIVNYRFFEWEINSNDVSTTVRGWRAVEAFNSNINFVAFAKRNDELEFLANFLIGGATAPIIQDYDYIPANSTLQEITQFQTNRDSLPTYQVNQPHLMVDDGVFSINNGISSEIDRYKQSEWYQRRQFNVFEGLETAKKHVFFNVHAAALKKRDIDKFAIERDLAEEIESDIKSGKNSYFPFMDDPLANNPTTDATNYLSSSNCVFKPVMPVTSYSLSNLEAICGSLGSFPTNPADGVNTYHSFESNRITERFDRETRVLVERNFAVNASILGPQLITIEGRGGQSGSLSCIIDPSKEFAFLCHHNSDSFLCYNSFVSSHVQEAIRKLDFRPDNGSLNNINNENPEPNQFENLIGFTSMCGDLPGYFPGRSVSTSKYSMDSVFVYKTTSVPLIRNIYPTVLDSQIQEISFSHNDKISISVGIGYYEMIEIRYNLLNSEKNLDSLVIFKLGGQTVGVIDSISIENSFLNLPRILRINCKWMEGDTIDIVGDRIQEILIDSIYVIGVNEDQTKDFLDNRQSDSFSTTQLSYEERLNTYGVFFKTDVSSISEDDNSNIFIFFNDNDGGISCVSSNEYGDNWHCYYGIVEKFQGINCANPFVVTNFSSNECYVFFQIDGCIFCKRIPFSLFNYYDANLIERFQDIFVPSDGTNMPKETASIYTNDGITLRRKLLSFVAAGDLTNESVLSLLSKNLETGEFELTETRSIEIRNNDGSVSTEESTVRKTPFTIGQSTAFSNSSINDIFFSAYRKDNGEMKLWFLSNTINSENPQLQCHFSNDNGQNWFDFWEFINYQYNRVRTDEETNSQFIDQSSSGEVVEDISASNPMESETLHPFGINVHWSRLKRHKKNEDTITIDTDSQVLPIESPYLFIQTTSNFVFLFYIYKNCLLCKVFSDDIFYNAMNTTTSISTGMEYVKNIIERKTKSFFVDGFLNQEDLYEEIQDFYNESSNEVMSEGNILFRYHFAISSFNELRSISAQRVCAYELPNGHIRVFYKNNSNQLRSAIWCGTEWWCEEFMRSEARIGDFVMPEAHQGAPVTGGFNHTGF